MVGIFFSDHFGVEPEILKSYGALDICIVSDIPVFIDPFLLFNSANPDYRDLHDGILRYLTFLRDKSQSALDPHLVRELFAFREVRQNWLGFTLFGNGGQGLGRKFAESLHESLASIFSDFGDEDITDGAHLEKLCLIKDNVGRDNISDFTTNLIKSYLLNYTQEFARKYLTADRCSIFNVSRARFSYDTQSWVTEKFYLPNLRGDYVLLTPEDMLTRDETWISRQDMLDRYQYLPTAIPDQNLRASINNYFSSKLGVKSTDKERREAASETIKEYPVLIDYYIKQKELEGDEAERASSDKVARTNEVLIKQLQSILRDLEEKTDFYRKSWTSYDEALDRALAFKHYVEHEDGYRLLNKPNAPLGKEADAQLFFGLIWCKTEFDVNREPNNGRGPVDFKVSFGSGDKSLIEFKLASNTRLKRNLENQVPIYEQANKTRTSVKVIIFYNAKEQRKVATILRELKIADEKSIVVIDARRDNKPSASTA